MAKNTNKEIPKGELNRVDRLVANLAFSAMAELLLLPKKIDELKKLPAYVKDGEVYDFNDRSFGKTYKEDGEIFDVARVLKTQAVTQALKTAYVKALNLWMEVSEEDAKTGDSKPSDDAEVVEEPAEEAKPATDGEIDLLKSVVKLLKKDDIKGAKKLVKANKDHPKYKKAKKLIKGAE